MGLDTRENVPFAGLDARAKGLTSTVQSRSEVNIPSCAPARPNP